MECVQGQGALGCQEGWDAHPHHMIEELASVEVWGMVVVERAQYPITRLWGGEELTLGVEELVHTTQEVVNRALVEVKAERIRNAQYCGAVEVAVVEGVVWMVDGHHSLAAYRELELPAPATCYSLGGRDWITPPRYVNWGAHPLWARAGEG